MVCPNICLSYIYWYWFKSYTQSFVFQTCFFVNQGNANSAIRELAKILLTSTAKFNSWFGDSRFYGKYFMLTRCNSFCLKIRSAILLVIYNIGWICHSCTEFPCISICLDQIEILDILLVVCVNVILYVVNIALLRVVVVDIF